MYKLYYTDASPYARVVRIWIRELRLTGKISEVFQHPFDNNEEHLLDNPLGKVPCLVKDNGFSLIDSTLICEYLFEQEQDAKNLSLYRNIEGKKLYYLSKGLIDLAVARQQEKLREFQDEFWMERFEQGIWRSLKALENETSWLDSHDWCLTHISIGCALDYMLFRHSDMNWREQHPSLNSWFTQACSRASIKQTLPS